ncbi:MAG: pilus assembly protein PilM, partial [Planctomycetota bacterium]|nr:pilus assembly protein PilM [Planctomycetota bacterium]
MGRQVTGVDVGLRSACFLRGQYKGNTFQVKNFCIGTHGADSLEQAWDSMEVSFKPQAARVALTGRDVNIRYTRVPQVPDWQLRKLMRFEVEEVGDASGASVASDFNLLPDVPEIEGEDIVLLALARDPVMDTHLAGLAAVNGAIDSFAPASLGLYNAWTHYGVVEDETVMLVNIGHENTDVVIVRGPDLLFARNLTGGSGLFDEAIGQRFGVGLEQAEQIKIQHATLQPGARYENANAEKASRCILGAAGQLTSLLQSAVLFCRSQIKVTSLKVDRVLLCGGGAGLEGLPEYLAKGMGMAVELFDPFRVVDVSALTPEEADLLDEYKLESVVALGLATMGSAPEAYSIEVLPADLRRKREFFGGTIYLVASALLALCFLAYHGTDYVARLGAVRDTASRLNRQVRSASSAHMRTDELVAKGGENDRLKEIADDLHSIAGSGEQLARVMEALEGSLPRDFWVSQITSEFAFDGDLGVERGAERPILRIEGRS